MEWSVACRSASLRTRKRCSTPTPRSKPSRMTYPTIITATSQNQRKPIFESSIVSVDSLPCGVYRFRHRRGGRRPVADLAVHQDREKQSEQCVQSHESEQSKQTVSGRNRLRVAGAGTHEPINQPGLPAEFCSQPTSGVCNVGQRKAQQQRPKHAAESVELSTPKQEGGDDHEKHEPGPQPRHDVIRVEKQRK